MRATTRLRHLIAGGRIVVAPGAFDGLSARLVEAAGFPVVYATGGGISRSAGIPDMGLLGMTEVAERLTSIVEVISVPVIGDADTGYGNALNVRRTVRAFERAGVAGFHLEDQQFPKRCGHYDDKSVIPAAEMVQKLKAARDAAIDPDLVIIARTDALAVEGMERTLDRARAYAEAGADVIFVEAPRTLTEIETIARALPTPKLINMFQGGKTPVVPVATLEALGYRVVIIPSDLQRAAIQAMREVLVAISRDGNSETVADRMVSFREREVVVNGKEYDELSTRYRV
jgi:2-methylisocitrate lyase-like PEP mutase family enzyme